MEQFINNEGEKLLIFKNKVFKRKDAFEFIEKLTMRDNEESIKKELNKCLFNQSALNNIKNNEKAIRDREIYIEQFIINLRNAKKNIKNKEEKEKEKKEEIILSHDEYGPKVAINDQNFPPLNNAELVKKAKKNKYIILDEHYKNNLEKGIKKCFCYGSRHPLVGNCLNCGRVMCLQEGEEYCIECGEKLITQEKYKKNIVYDNDAKTAFNHKEKLLEFQKQFYKKLEIIDDFNDWYEVSNNTWLPLEEREKAREKDIANEEEII